jgi:hypothetical protein
MLILVAGSGDVSGRGISDESDNAAVTIGSNSCEADAVSVAWACVTGRVAVSTSAASNEIDGSLSVNLASVVRGGARRSVIEAAPVLSMPAKPYAAIQARTKAGMATSRPKAAIAANRGFTIAVSNLHRVQPSM